MSELALMPELSDVVVLLPNGERVKGSYDGYGRVGSRDLMDEGAFDEAKFVLSKFYQEEKFEDLGPSHFDPGQGWFHDDTALKNWLSQGGFPSQEAFLRAFNGIA